MQKTKCSKRQSQGNAAKRAGRRPEESRRKDSAPEAVVARQYPKVYARASVRVASHPTMAIFVDANDIAQSVFRRYLSASENGEPIECESAWFLRTTDHRFIEQCRFEKAAKRNRRREDQKIEASYCASRSLGPCEKAIAAEAEERALASLKPRDREILVKRHFKGIKIEAIAEDLNIAPESVQKYDRRIEGQIREFFEA